MLSLRKTFLSFSRFLVPPEAQSREQIENIRNLERGIVIPTKAVLILTLVYFFFFANWVDDIAGTRGQVVFLSPRTLAVDSARKFFVVYGLLQVTFAVLIAHRSLLGGKALQWLIFFSGLLDAALLASLTLITGGFDSIIYWLFLGLIAHNAASIPFAAPQILLNIVTSLFYVLAGIIDVAITQQDEELIRTLDINSRTALGLTTVENPAEPFLLRISVLLLMTACAYGLRVLLERQKMAEQDAEAFSARHEQLQAAGRLAAEIAHQIKNPLAIINNASFSLQRAVQDGKKSVNEQIQIIREEVERADRIITEVMGYAQLAEGKVERVNVIDELERAIAQVFPAAANYQVAIQRHYGPNLPSLLVQRGHLSEVFVNLLINAREAMDGKGTIDITTRALADAAIEVIIADTGPGIPGPTLAKVFEAYFTTKEKGTGLGLAIVKHNTELYGGEVRVESKLGLGAAFILKFPAKTFLRHTS